MTITNNIVLMPRHDLTVWLDGFAHGRAEGLAAGFAIGQADADDEMSRLQQGAARVVRTVSSAPVRDAAADRAAAEKRAAYWAGRRGEGQ